MCACDMGQPCPTHREDSRYDDVWADFYSPEPREDDCAPADNQEVYLP